MDVMCSTWVNSIGLVLDICGAILLWKYGLPESISREGHQYIVLGQKDEAEAAKAKTYDRWSKLGLSLLILGFVLQLVSNFI
jgi:hypothetical protein